MARPIKDGVDYFPKDTDFYSDDKVRLLRAEFGAKGMYMIDYLLCEIYRKNGYFLKWDKKQLFLVSDGAGCGCTPEYISEFISGCIRCSFFDQRVFNMFGVITSAGIQLTFDGDQCKYETTGCNRTGCMFCAFGLHLEKGKTRFQLLKETHPKQYEYCINGGEFVNGVWQPNKKGLGLGYVFDEINKIYGNDFIRYE